MIQKTYRLWVASLLTLCSASAAAQQKVEILPYHTLGVHKYEAMGQTYQLKGIKENTPEQTEHAAGLFKEYFKTVQVN